MLFYGNKTTFQIIGFNANVVAAGDLADALQIQVLVKYVCFKCSGKNVVG